jgi:hypothetical protein
VAGHASHKSIYIYIAKKPLIGSLYRDLAKRPPQEICTELLPRGLLQRFCQDTSCRELVQRPGAENGDLAQISFIEGLILRSLTGIFCGDIL